MRPSPEPMSTTWSAEPTRTISTIASVTLSGVTTKGTSSTLPVAAGTKATRREARTSRKAREREVMVFRQAEEPYRSVHDRGIREAGPSRAVPVTGRGPRCHPLTALPRQRTIGPKLGDSARRILCSLQVVGAKAVSMRASLCLLAVIAACCLPSVATAQILYFPNDATINYTIGVWCMSARTIATGTPARQ
jgi:hypothetical protein